MKSTFADTYFYLALLNPKDAGHGKALSAVKSITTEIVTTAWVITELGDALCDPADRGEFLALLRSLRNDPLVRIIGPEETLFDSTTASNCFAGGRTRNGR